MEDLAGYPSQAAQPHNAESASQSCDFFDVEAWEQNTTRVSSTPVRNSGQRALTRGSAWLSHKDLLGPGSNQFQFLDHPVGTTGLIPTDDDGMCLGSYWTMAEGPPSPQYIDESIKEYPGILRQNQMATMSSPYSSFQQRDFESSSAMRSEGQLLRHSHTLLLSNNPAELIPFEGIASYNVGGYVAAPPFPPAGDNIPDLGSAFRSNNACGLIFPVSHALSHEDHAADGGFDIRSIVPTNEDLPPGNDSIQTSDVSNIYHQTPRVDKLTSSAATFSPAIRKCNKRKFTEVEKAAIKHKRKVGVCADCRKAKRRVCILLDWGNHRLKEEIQCTHVLGHASLESGRLSEDNNILAKAASPSRIGETQERSSICEACGRRSVISIPNCEPWALRSNANYISSIQHERAGDFTQQ